MAIFMYVYAFFHYFYVSLHQYYTIFITVYNSYWAILFIQMSLFSSIFVWVVGVIGALREESLIWLGFRKQLERTILLVCSVHVVLNSRVRQGVHLEVDGYWREWHCSFKNDYQSFLCSNGLLLYSCTADKTIKY